MPQTNRRSFLANTAKAAAIAAPAFLGRAQERKLNVGIIGTGWWAGVDMNAAWAVGGMQCVAISDVDTAQSNAFSAECEKKQGAKPKFYKDYRDLLDHPGLDVLFLTTPPHWHALPFIAACQKGLPVYCEKPLAYDVREGQAMMAAQKKAGNIVQIGFQRRNNDAFHAAGEYFALRQARQDCPGGCQHLLQSRHPGPHAQGPARHPRLGAMVRSRSIEALLGSHRPQVLAP